MDERRRAPRKEITAMVEFIVDGHSILEARGVDLSEFGIGFESGEALRLALTTTVDGEEVIRHARLVRVMRQEDGNFLFGLEFDD